MKVNLLAVLFIFMITMGVPARVFAQPPSTLFPATDDSLLVKDTAIITAIENGGTQIYPRPEKWGFVTHVPGDLWQIAQSPFRKKNIYPLAAISISSALLIWQDQALLDGVKQFSKNIHLTAETNYKVVIDVAGTKVLKLPLNMTTAMYQSGQGGTSMLLAGGLFVYGKIKHDNRALQTASDLTETFITMGVATQLLKRSFGRQSPSMATRPGGKWQPFPAFSDYQQNTTNYDAFPSGHLATMIATITVLCSNYPEKKWILPAGIIMSSLLSYSMMNVGVHWAGDYPLAIAIGYLSGKITVNRHRIFNGHHTVLPVAY